MYLGKRDNQGFAIAPTLIVFLVILGAGALVICGSAVMRFYGENGEDDSDRYNRTPEQDSYMREVRDRNWSKLPNLVHQKQRSQPNSQLAHAPITPT